MPRVAAILFLLALTACNTPGRGFGGLPAVRAETDGTAFDIRRSGAYVEAIRRTPLPFPTFPPVARQGAVAAFRVTGCPPAWVVGDPSVLRIGLACEGKRAPPMPDARLRLSCTLMQDGPGGVTAGAGLFCRH